MRRSCSRERQQQQPRHRGHRVRRGKQQMKPFSLQLNPTEIPALAGRYAYASEAPIEQIGFEVKSRGYFTKNEFQELCRWKTPRTQGRVATNSETLVKEVTLVALSTAEEELRIKVLLCLDGVSWATGSTILHFAHRTVTRYSTFAPCGPWGSRNLHLLPPSISGGNMSCSVAA